MITTRFGSEVKVLESANEKGWVKVERVSDGAIHEWHVSEFKCDTKEDLKILYGEKS